MGRLADKVAIITGGARGLGGAQAELFAREGAVVIVTDVLERQGSALVERICANGGIAEFVSLDVTSEDRWKECVGAVEERQGRVDVLVNNAGVPLRRPIEETSIEEWNWVFAVNLTGTFLGIKTTVPAMRRAGGGSIVNMSSAAALVASTTAAYGAAKAGVRSLTKSVAAQYASENIRCNSVHPGPMDTEINRESQLNVTAWAERMKRVPIGRIGQPLEVAYGVLYLASDESAYVTGSELVIDGGSTAI